MTDIKDGGSAFPFPDDRRGCYDARPRGMSLRDWFAGKAMAAIVGAYREQRAGLEPNDENVLVTTTTPYRDMMIDSGIGSQEIAEDAYAIADAMLAEREKTP